MNSVTLIGRRDDDIRAYTITDRYVALLVTMGGRTGAWGRWYPNRQQAEQYLWAEAKHLDESGWNMDDPIFRDLTAPDIAVLMLLDPVKPSYPNPGLQSLMMGGIMTAITVIGRLHTEVRAHTLLDRHTVTLVNDSRAPDKLVVAGASHADRERAEAYFLEMAEELDGYGFTIESPVTRFLLDWEAEAIEEIAGLPQALTHISPEIRALLLAA